MSGFINRHNTEDHVHLRHTGMLNCKVCNSEIGLVYLAIPYSSGAIDRSVSPSELAEIKQRRFEIANKVTADLLRQGYIVFSPISHSHPIALQEKLPGEFAFWQKYCETVISRCNLVLITKILGWEDSIGVTAEIRIATILNIPIKFVSDQGVVFDGDIET